MKIFSFILMSVLIHTLIIVYLYLPFSILPPKKLAVYVLKVQLIQDRPRQANIKDKHIATVNNSEYEGLKKSSTNIKIFYDKPVSSDVETSKQEAFLSGNDVDRKAIPQNGLDSEKLLKNLSSGLPIKLRLYISSFGRLVKIERIGVQQQDMLFVEQLEDQLKKITFLPAVRNGVNVSSYQEIEFDFSHTSAIETN